MRFKNILLLAVIMLCLILESHGVITKKHKFSKIENSESSFAIESSISLFDS